MKLETPMLTVFKPNGIDWLEVERTKSNYFTYHHIFKACYGGGVTLDNGAILTDMAHKWLHRVELNQIACYNKLNELFKCLNDTKAPPSVEYWRELKALLEWYGRQVNDDAKKYESSKHKRSTRWCEQREGGYTLHLEPSAKKTN